MDERKVHNKKTLSIDSSGQKTSDSSQRSDSEPDRRLLHIGSPTLGSGTAPSTAGCTTGNSGSGGGVSGAESLDLEGLRINVHIRLIERVGELEGVASPHWLVGLESGDVYRALVILLDTDESLGRSSDEGRVGVGNKNREVLIGRGGASPNNEIGAVSNPPVIWTR